MLSRRRYLTKGMVAKSVTFSKDWKGNLKYFRKDQVRGGIDKVIKSVLTF